MIPRNIRNFLYGFVWCIVGDNQGTSESSPASHCSFYASFDPSDVDLHKMKTQHFENPNSLIIGHLNINLIRKKIEVVAETLPWKCPNTEFFLVRPYSVQIRENTDKKYSVFGHFSLSEKIKEYNLFSSLKQNQIQVSKFHNL